MQFDFVVRAIGHVRILGYLRGQRDGGPGHGAGSRDEPPAYRHHRNSSNATRGPPQQPSLRPPRPGPTPLSAPGVPLVKPDASRSFAAADSAGPAGRARSGPHASPGSADRPRADCARALARDTPRCSTAARGRSRCTAAPPAGTVHTRTSARADPRHPRPRQPASKPPLRAPKRLRSRLCSSVGRDPSVGAILRPHCAQHGGVRRFEQLSGRMGRRARSDSRRRPPFYCCAGGIRKAPSAEIADSADFATPTRGAYRARCPQSSRRPSQHTAGRRLVHGGGRSALATNRPTAAVGKPCSPHRLRQYLVNAPQSPGHRAPSSSTAPYLLGQFW